MPPAYGNLTPRQKRRRLFFTPHRAKCVCRAAAGNTDANQGRALSTRRHKVTDVSRTPKDVSEAVSMEEIDAETSVALPNKEVLSLLDVNANVDLGLDLAAPVDLAAAANLNVAAPIEAAASANLLSPDATAVSEAYQHGTLDQGISGSAEATAPQHADIAQNANPAGDGTTTDGTTGTTDGTSTTTG